MDRSPISLSPSLRRSPRTQQTSPVLDSNEPVEIREQPITRVPQSLAVEDNEGQREKSTGALVRPTRHAASAEGSPARSALQPQQSRDRRRGDWKQLCNRSALEPLTWSQRDAPGDCHQAPLTWKPDLEDRGKAGEHPPRTTPPFLTNHGPQAPASHVGDSAPPAGSLANLPQPSATPKPACAVGGRFGALAHFG